MSYHCVRVSVMRNDTWTPKKSVRAARRGSAQSKRVGEDARDHRSDGIAQIPPEAIDADRSSAPARIGNVIDGSQQRRVDQNGLAARG